MHPSDGVDKSQELTTSEVGHEYTGCPVSHDLQEGEPIGWGWGGSGCGLKWGAVYLQLARNSGSELKKIKIHYKD